MFRQELNVGLSTPGVSELLGKRKLSPEVTTPTGVPGKLTPEMFASPKLRQRLVSETMDITSNWARLDQKQVSRPRANTVASPSTLKTRRKVTIGRRKNNNGGRQDPNQQLLTNMLQRKQAKNVDEGTATQKKREEENALL